MFGALKWLENRETSVFLSLKGFNYCLLLEFSQVVYYNEGAISRSAPIFRDFQAIFPGTVSTWPMFRHFQAISGKGGAKNGAIADLSLFSSQRGQMKV